MSYGDGFFDGDADIEMAEFEAEGNRRYRLLRWATEEQKQTLHEGGTVERPGKVKETGARYVAAVRLAWPPFELLYSVAGGPERSTMREARHAAETERRGELEALEVDAADDGYVGD